MLASLLLTATFPAELTLTYERSNFLRTGRYDETVTFSRALARRSPNVRVVQYGVSPAGRPMIAIHISSARTFDPAARKKANRPLIFVQNGIHSGEIEGKDASLLLARDMVLSKKHPALYRDLDWLIVPVYSLDAHERFGPFNRINQNGPEEMGWRATDENYNLNRDWVKADGGETQAQLRLLNRFQPDLTFDNHTTNGADYQYVLTLGLPTSPIVDDALAQWNQRWYNLVSVQTERDGFPTAPYFSLADRLDPTKGISISEYGPRFSHGYMAMRNRPSLLVETHMLKAYRPRVESTYSVMVRTAELVQRERRTFLAMIQDLDARNRNLAGKPLVLESELTDQRDPFRLRGYEVQLVDSASIGGRIPRWDRTRPRTFESTLRQTFRPRTTVTLPAAYVVGPGQQEIRQRLDWHGIRYQVLRTAESGPAEETRFSGVTFATRPFEGRFAPRFTKTTRTVPITFPPYSLVVPVNGNNGRLLAHLLEADSPDSFLRWGMLNTIFESKEYAEDYALGPIADRLLRENPALRSAFEERLRDPEFAGSPAARRQWLYENSPYFDQALNRYPVWRVAAGAIPSVP